MNTILQKRIEEASIEYTMRTRPMCIAGGAFADMAREFNKNPDFIAGATFALQNQWTSVDEALPPSDDRLKSISIDVMVKNEYGKVTSAWYDYERKEWHLSYGEIAGDDLIDSKITHWMQIPKIKGGEK